jgi:hypothetical protein
MNTPSFSAIEVIVIVSSTPLGTGLGVLSPTLAGSLLPGPLPPGDGSPKPLPPAPAPPRPESLKESLDDGAYPPQLGCLSFDGRAELLSGAGSGRFEAVVKALVVREGAVLPEEPLTGGAPPLVEVVWLCPLWSSGLAHGSASYPNDSFLTVLVRDGMEVGSVRFAAGDAGGCGASIGCIGSGFGGSGTFIDAREGVGRSGVLN